MRHLPAMCAAVLAAVLPACRRGPPPPSPQYEQARAQYDQLYLRHLDDAYARPEMAEVEKLLQQVGRDTADYDAAQRMLGAIKSGREQHQKERAGRDAQGEVEAPRPVTNIDPTEILRKYEVDAGPPPDPYGPGAQIAEINAATGGCLVGDQPFTEQGTGRTGRAYKLANVPECRQKLPGFVDQLVLVTGGVIYRRVPASEAKVEGGGAEPQQQPQAAPQQAPAQQPAPAAEERPQTIQTLPGAPVPEGYEAAGEDAGTP